MAMLRKGTNKNQELSEIIGSDDSFSESDDENDPLGKLRNDNEDKYNLDKRVMARYGTGVDHKKSLTNYYIKFTGVLIVLILIPTEIVIRNTIFDLELDGIIRVQTRIRDGGSALWNFFDWFAFIVTFPARNIFVNCLAAFIYLVLDPVLGFKSALTLYFGAFVISMIKLFYKVPRPYWMDRRVTGLDCLMDFSGPSDSIFFVTFFYSYNLIIFLVLYSKKKHKVWLGISLGLLSLVIILQIFLLNFRGTVFYLESMIGVVYGVIYTAICLSLDSEIHKISEFTAFIIKTSKKYKFYLLFFSLILFAIALVYYNAELITWRAPQLWIVNSQEECDFDENFEIRLGLDATFLHTAAIFGLIGLGFGASMATKIVDNVGWAHTALWKRIIRGIIGVAIYVGIFVAFWFIPRVDLPTAYFFNQILPHLVATFSLYGLIPILCKYIGLIQQRESDEVSSSSSSPSQRDSAKGRINGEGSPRQEPLIEETKKEE